MKPQSTGRWCSAIFCAVCALWAMTIVVWIVSRLHPIGANRATYLVVVPQPYESLAAGSACLQSDDVSVALGHGAVCIYLWSFTEDLALTDFSNLEKTGWTPIPSARAETLSAQSPGIGFAAHYEAFDDPHGKGHGTDGFCRIPFWSVGVLLSFWPVARFGGRIRRYWRAAQGKCPKCGYDLRASPGRCPECGLIR
jgi:hypothetical protein